MMGQHKAFIHTLIFLFSTHIIQSQNADIIKEDSLSHLLENANSYNEQVDVLTKIVKLTRTYDYKKSIIYSNQGQELANNNDDTIQFALFQLESGITNYFLGNYDATLKLYFSALSVFEKEKHFIGSLRTLNNIGAVYDRIENFHKAINYYQLCIQLFNETPEEIKTEYYKYLSQIYNNLASAYEKLGEDKRAIQYYEKALKTAEIDYFPDITSSIYNNLGKIEVQNGNYNMGKEYIDKAIQIRKENSLTEGLVKSYYFLSDYYNHINLLDSAEWAAKQSLKLAKQRGLLESQQVAHMFLYQIYEDKGLLAKALEEHKLYKTLSDSLLNEKKMNQLAQMQISFELEKIEEQAILEKTELKSQYTIMIVALSAILIVSLLGTITYRNQKKRVDLENKNLELEIDTKNRELTTNVMYLVQKNELINNVAKSLLNLKKNLKQENQRSIQEVIYNLNAESDNEIWNEFEYRFQMVHTDFYKKLRYRHSDITPSEERLAALLRLNLSSKEISTITHQTVRSVEVARGRLRKKLNLTGTDINLVSYLSDL
nr:tetratricopeptide repeat protein [uncultured Carboxylicivirga sp.]